MNYELSLIVVGNQKGIKRLLRKNNGFTIVELLIVIVIIAILAAITIVAFNGIQGRSRDTERKQDIANIRKMLELYYIDNATFPLSAELSSKPWRQANLIAQNDDMFINPQDSGSTYSLVASGSSVPLNKYSYYPVLAGGSLCTVSGQCRGYRMAYKLEENPTANVIIVLDK